MVIYGEAAMISKESLDAHHRLAGTMGLCSWNVGWRSLLLRAYIEPPEAENLVTAATSDHLIVLVAEGKCRIEGQYARRWQEAVYLKGDIGMTAPEEEVHLRWREGRNLKTLQLHLPSATLADVASLDPGCNREIRLPNQLVRPDPTIHNVLLSLARAAKATVSELYADSVAHFLANHLLTFHCGAPPVQVGNEPKRMALADALLRESLRSNLSLDQLAAAAGMSKYHLLRVFKETFGETPFRRLTRYRMEAARELLHDADATVSRVGYSCGYENPTHFAITFRRFYGLSPSAYKTSFKIRQQSSDADTKSIKSLDLG